MTTDRYSEKWDRRFLHLAQHLAEWSKDPSTKVGCVVVGPAREIRSTGYNGLPRGIEDTNERLGDRELKYPLTVHAEANALLHASRIGVGLKGCTVYVTWPSCIRCAVSMIQVGITRVVWPKTVIPERWATDFAWAHSILEEAEMIITEVVL